MSVYNKEAFLKSAIDSILSQTFSDFEFVIRDNCSNDSSVSIIESYSDSRITFSRNSRNLGPVPSINICLESAQGEYIVFAHGDDIWEPDFLETSINAFKQFPDAKISHALAHSIDENGLIQRLECPTPPPPSHTLFSHIEALDHLFKGTWIRMTTAMLHKSVMKYIDVRYIYSGDWNLWLSIASSEAQFVLINKPLVYYRTSAASETSRGITTGEMVIEDFLVLRNFFITHPQYSKYKSKALGRLSRSIIRRSRNVNSRDTLVMYFWVAIMCAPFNILNPGYYFILIVGLLFGPKGTASLKAMSKNVRKLTRAVVTGKESQ